MKLIITEIRASATTGFNHPHEQFANFKPSLTLTASVEGTEAEIQQAIVDLQKQVHSLVMREKESILARCRYDYDLEQAEHEAELAHDALVSLEAQIEQARTALADNAAYEAHKSGGGEPILGRFLTRYQLDEFNDTIARADEDLAAAKKRMADTAKKLEDLKAAGPTAS